jgi:YVTN family beta-propeller protein
MKLMDILFGVALKRLLVLMLLIIIFTVNVQGEPFAYIPNYESNTVSVIDIATNTVVWSISVGAEPWGVAVSPDGTRVYVRVCKNQI